jgi:hypothetical protein
MDELEKRLKADAEDIRAEITPELQSRLDVAALAFEVAPAATKSTVSSGSLWWASSLTGLVAAMVVIVLVSWNRESVEVVTPETFGSTPQVNAQVELPLLFPLNASTADLTEPLEDELKKLQADLETARESVARDLRSSF